MKSYIVLLLLFFSLLFVSCTKDEGPASSVVELKLNDQGNYRLFVNGDEFYVKGAGLEYSNIDVLSKYGANSFRTWSTDNGKHSGYEILDKAAENGLMVLMGLEIGRERHGFDYDDPIWVNEQYEYIKQEVIKYKDHPALLAWGIGNELNLNYENLKVWNAVNDISKMIHEIDPNHPTTTMLAGIGKNEINYMSLHCNDLDFISIQFYGELDNLKRHIENSAYDGPYMVTEWGATGHWEVDKTSWGAPIEQTSQEKAKAFMHRYGNVILEDEKHCMGSYVFLWGQKQERTPTWYGLFLENGEKTEIVDAMHYAWNGEWPLDRAPTIDSLRIDGKSAFQNVIFGKGELHEAEAFARAIDGDSLSYRWEVMPESKEVKIGGDYENRPETILALKSNPVQFKTPAVKGAYRIFVYITDEVGNSATGNIPFFVE